MKTYAAFAILLAFSTLTPARANDGFGALAAGGIVVGRTDKIAMVKERLRIGYRWISVEYEFLNESDEDITETVSFPLPEYPATPIESGIVAAGEPKNFAVYADRKQMTFRTKVFAILNGADVTEQLIALGFTEQEIALVPFEPSMQKSHELTRPAAQLDALRAAGLLDEYGPTWTNKVVYEWTQTFPARRVVAIRHSYRPFIALGTASGYTDRVEDNELLKTEFCASEEALKRLQNLASDADYHDSYNQVPGTIVEYVLKTANTWKDGIRDFTLHIEKGAPTEIVATCFEGELKKVSGTGLEVNLKNYRPQSDLKIYFGNAWGYGTDSANKPPRFP